MNLTIDVNVVMTIMSLAGGAVALLSAYRAYRERKNSPAEKRWEELGHWQKEVDRKLANDNESIKMIERGLATLDAFQRLLLKATKGMLHLSRGDNAAEEAERIEGEIDRFLIEKNS